MTTLPEKADNIKEPEEWDDKILNKIKEMKPVCDVIEKNRFIHEVMEKIEKMENKETLINELLDAVMVSVLRIEHIIKMFEKITEKMDDDEGRADENKIKIMVEKILQEFGDYDVKKAYDQATIKEKIRAINYYEEILNKSNEQIGYVFPPVDIKT